MVLVKHDLSVPGLAIYTTDSHSNRHLDAVVGSRSKRSVTHGATGKIKGLRA